MDIHGSWMHSMLQHHMDPVSAAAQQLQRDQQDLAPGIRLEPVLHSSALLLEGSGDEWQDGW